MFLQKIEILGFKSFANKTVLEFPHPGKGCPLTENGASSPLPKKICGIAAIVGPNGSGKSNIADAIRWALGEQSMKSVRGKKSDDVIFSGSDRRGRLGMAEVSLHINNEDKTVDIDYPEVVITRRLYRSGEGEYLINKSKVRLQDILMLIAKANFGQKSYSIISQGMIDSILVASPAERKEFFDEAVGVRQFQIKRDQSINKLELAWQNLKSVEVLLNEIEPRLRSLTRQVNRLEKREIIEKELRQVQISYFGTLWHDIENKIKGLKPEYENLKDQTEKKQSELSLTKNKLFDLEKQDSRTENFNRLQSNFQKLLEEKNGLTEKQLILKNKIELARQRSFKMEAMPLSEVINRLKESRKIQDELKNAIDQKNFSEILKFSQKLEESLKVLISDLENPQKKKISEIDPALEKEQQSILEKLKDLESKVKVAQADIDGFNQKQDEQKGEFFQLQRQYQKQQTDLNFLNGKNSELRVELTRLETKREDLEEEIKDEMKDFAWLDEYQSQKSFDETQTLQQIHHLKHQLELIGGIDPEAVKEYRETKERFDFLSGQSEDLNKSISSLEEVIKDLDENIHLQFDSSFKNINNEFQKYFKILFNGGRAELSLIKEEKKAEKEIIKEEIGNGKNANGNDASNDEKKPWKKLESDKTIKGIEIFATPPGKKLKNISMLSGGERALTSIALICAIISNNPSPFVVLDEVDAALDEANSQRFAQILDELSHKTQFITITHNRATMYKANILYGVSMGDDGVSKLLSIKLEDAEALVNR
ncbi:hypothetical protein C4569_03580 [Candidatus Parcubacteria bacterium]|nr:MAG: hypothetical protein C4569_03580 [Candidatus Parcubacteria bacterium]